MQVEYYDREGNLVLVQNSPSITPRVGEWMIFQSIMYEIVRVVHYPSKSLIVVNLQ